MSKPFLLSILCLFLYSSCDKEVSQKSEKEEDVKPKEVVEKPKKIDDVFSRAFDKLLKCEDIKFITLGKKKSKDNYSLGQVLGESSISAEDLNSLRKAIRAGIDKGSLEKYKFKGFQPTHAIWAKGKDIEIGIKMCFKYSQMHLIEIEPKNQGAGFFKFKASREIFDQIAKKYNLKQE